MLTGDETPSPVSIWIVWKKPYIQAIPSANNKTVWNKYDEVYDSMYIDCVYYVCM